MKKVLIAIVATVVVGSSVFFYACKKDTETSQFTQVKNLKSTGNYQQSTQDVDINTVIRVGTVDYPVTGSAVIGNYDGRMYECNVTWEMPEPTTGPAPIAPTYLTVTLTATLKPEYHDVMINVDLVMENYDITITPTMVTEEVDVADLWQNIVDICNAHAEATIDTAYILALSQETGINIFELASMPYITDYMEYIYGIYELYSDDNGLIISIPDFTEILDSESEDLFLALESGIENDFPTFYYLNEYLQDMVLEVTEELCCATKPGDGGLKGIGMFNLRCNFAEWQQDKGFITASEKSAKVCKAQQKLIKRNGAAVVYRYMDDFCHY